MVDFLKSFPFVNMEEYRWGLSVPMIALMSIDNTRVNHLTEDEASARTAEEVDFSNKASLQRCGIPMIGM